MAQQEEVQLWQTVAPVEFIPRIESRTDAQALLISTRQSPGYQICGGQLAHAIQSRATHLLMDFSQNACAMRYQIDGNWEQLPPLDRETGDALLQALKRLCLMNPADRRSAQTGKCTLKVGKDKFDLTVQSQGVPTGERVLAKIENQQAPFERMSDLGMRDKMVTTFKENLNGDGNLVLISAPKGEGLTTTWTIALNAADRLVRDFQSFEDKDHPEPEIINVNPCFYGGDTGLTQLDILKKMLLKEPDVLIFPQLPEDETFSTAIKQVDENEKQIYTRMIANTAMEALTSLMAKYPDSATKIARRTGAVLCQKLVRRLCGSMMR